ncbi:MAG: NAD(+)/NADH kinase, partial [Candidatus Eremiobacteraeota bacterium]|nr:NAD(+)/NADH kinase [Candidatus Eremiobacteraeota bacterium]
MDAPPRAGTIALYVDLFRDHARAAAEAIAAKMRDAGFDVALCDDQERVLGLSSHGASIAEAFVLVTIGGDGTLLRAAQIAAPHGIPLFGINSGRLGFLTEMDGNDAALVRLPEILRAGFEIDERTAVQAEVHGRVYFALNDVVVTRTAPHMTPFGLFIDGREAAHVPADGIVGATPTGSTAYSLSAGGPIVAPSVDAFIVTALLPHTLFSRPLVVPTSSTIVVACDAETSGVALEADGQVVDTLLPGESVTVRRYPRPVRFARREPLDFFALLEGKLRWNAPVKDR